MLKDQNLKSVYDSELTLTFLQCPDHLPLELGQTNQPYVTTLHFGPVTEPWLS